MLGANGNNRLLGSQNTETLGPARGFPPFKFLLQNIEESNDIVQATRQMLNRFYIG
jgi:hypothetical protein